MNTLVHRQRLAASFGKMCWHQRLLGFVLLGGALALLLDRLYGLSSGLDQPMRGALLGGGIAAAATAAGTLPVLFAQQFSQRTYDAMLGFGSGVMLGATAFSLIIPALSALREGGEGAVMSSMIVGGGIGLGAALILGLEKLVSHRSEIVLEQRTASPPMRHAWMFVGAVALHNIPEGLAIGVAYAGNDGAAAQNLTTAIALQDVPEGLVAALALRTVGYSRGVSVLYGAATGLVEPMAAVMGAAALSVASGLLPVGLALAAGAMLFVIVNDVIPESHRSGNGQCSSAALVAGFITMTILDTAMA